MKYLLGIVCLIFVVNVVNAQGDESKMRAARIGFITNRLDLTPQQAEKFWPVYNEYTKKRENIQDGRRQDILEKRKDGITDEEAKKMIENELKLRQDEFALDQEYYAKFQEVIEPKQVLKLIRAERDFNMEVLRNLANRSNFNDQMRRQPPQQRPPDNKN